ncbi:MAG: TIM barrel protein [Candidatus Micrarchaeota archaeon]
MMRFGTAGIPIRCKSKGSLAGIKCVRDLGLEAMEFEFVQGVKMSESLAKECGNEAKRLDVSLSAHAPYFINLISEKPQTRNLSKHHIMETCRVLDAAGGGRAVFHAGFYGKKQHQAAFGEMLVPLADLRDRVRDAKLKAVLAPELSGKRVQWGSLSELCDSAKQVSGLNPCIDFAHMFARGDLKKDDGEHYGKALDSLGEALGRQALQSLHIHFSGIEFSEKGERRHLPVGKPAFAPLARALKERKCSGTIICESPLIEEDALKMQKTYFNAP